MTNVSHKAMSTPFLPLEAVEGASKDTPQGVVFADFFNSEIAVKSNMFVQASTKSEWDIGDKPTDSDDEIASLDFDSVVEEIGFLPLTNDRFSGKMHPIIETVSLGKKSSETVSAVKDLSGKAGSVGETDEEVLINNLHAAMSVSEVGNEVARRPAFKRPVPNEQPSRTSEPFQATIRQKSAAPTAPVFMTGGFVGDGNLETLAAENSPVQLATFANPYRMGSDGAAVEAQWAEGRLRDFEKNGKAELELKAQQVKIPTDKLEPVRNIVTTGLEPVPIKLEPVPIKEVAKVVDSQVSAEIGKLTQGNSTAIGAQQDMPSPTAVLKGRVESQVSGNLDRVVGARIDSGNPAEIKSSRDHETTILSNPGLRAANSDSLLPAQATLRSNPLVQSAIETMANSQSVAAPVLNSNKSGRDNTEFVVSTAKSDRIETVKGEIPSRQDLSPLTVSQAVGSQTKALPFSPIFLEGQTKSLEQAGEGGQHSEVFGVGDRMSSSSQISTPHDLKTQQATQVASSVGHQIAVEVNKTQRGTTEIALNPEELGRVSLTMRALEGSVTLIISAERPETQDLMRRHIETLAQEFRSLGYSDVNLSFQDHGQSNRKGAEGRGAEAASIADVEPAEIDKQKVKSDGLDLRL